MKSNFSAPRLWILNAISILAFGLLGSRAFGGDAPKEVAVSDRVAQAKNVNEESEKRIKAIESLAAISEKDVLDNHVIDALIDVAKGDPDPFVRVSAIRTLGVIERNVTHAHNAKTAYLEPFADILKKSDDYPPVRVAVASVFKDTLIPTELKDRDVAFKALVDIVNIKDPKTAKEMYGLKLECIAGIGNFASPQSLDILMSLLNDPDPIVKETVAKAIFNLLNKTSESAGNVTFATVKKLVDIMEDNTIYARPPRTTRKAISWSSIPSKRLESSDRPRSLTQSRRSTKPITIRKNWVSLC